MALQVQIEAQFEQFVTATKAMKEFFGGVMQGMREELKATADEAERSMKQHESAFENFATILKSKMSGVTGIVEGVKIAWAQLAVIFEAGHFLADAAEDSVKLVRESQDLGRQLGISATQASYLKVALGNVHATTDQYLSLAKGMTTQLRTHETAMQSMGLVTRDANGNLRDTNDLIIDANTILQGYKAGTDRNVAAQTLFGKSVNTSNEALELNRKAMQEGEEKAKALALAVGEDNVEAQKKFEDASHNMGLILEGVKNAIGQALLPVLGDLAKWFTDYGPQAMLTIRKAIGIVVSLFKGLALAVSTLWNLVTIAFKNMGASIEGFAEMFVAAIHGDWSGAMDAGKKMLDALQQNASAAFGKIVDNAADTGGSITDMWKDIVNPPATKDSGKPEGGTAAAGGGSGGGSRHGAAAQREAQQAKQALDDIAKARMKAEEEAQRVDDMRAQAARDLALKQIDVEEDAARSREAIGQITGDQLIALEKQFEERRFEIREKFLQDQADANQRRVEEHAKTLIELEALEADYRARVASLNNQAAEQAAQRQEQQAQFLGGALNNAVNGMIQRTMTWKQAMGSIMQQYLQQFIQIETMKAARYLVGQRMMTAANLMGNTMRTAADKASATQSKMANAKTATQSITSSGASVFGKVYDAIAGIPYVGPFLAPAMAAAAFGAVMGYAGKISSAAGGYDIPAGVNPVTQLHEKEMVLPAKHAEVIRGMADQGGGQQAGNTTNINVSALDMRSVSEALRRNPNALADAMRYAGRMGHLVRVS